MLPWLKSYNKLDGSAMSRDADVCNDFENDALCHNTGTLLGLAEMLERAKQLRSRAVQKRFPPKLPVLVLHGSGDRVTWHEASRSFVDGLQVRDKTYKEYDGWFHKMHAEPGEDRARFANDVIDRNQVIGCNRRGRRPWP